MLERFSLKFKLIAGFLVSSLILLGVGVANYAFMNKVNASYNHVSSINFENEKLLNEMFLRYTEIRLNLVMLNLPDLPAEAKETSRSVVISEIKAFDASNQKYTEVPFVEGEEALYKPVDENWNRFKALAEKALASEKNDSEVDRKIFSRIVLLEIPKSGDAFRAAMTALVKFQRSQADTWTGYAKAASSDANIFGIIGVLSGFVISLFLGFMISNRLASSLQSAIDRVAEGSKSVGENSQAIATSSSELSESTTEQAAAIQETAAAVEEVTAMIKKNSDSSVKSRDVSRESLRSAADGKSDVSEMIKAIHEISDSNHRIMEQVERGNQEIAEIVKVIAEIGDKTKVINDIVFQTKLLSFNASVEAARAGEHGKGFAVVADEVGKLAEMSGKSAKEISGLLESSLGRVQGIVDSTKSRVESQIGEGKEKIQHGTQVAENCGRTLDRIHESIAQVDQRIADIAAASSEQATGMAEINKAMSQLDQVTQQNAEVSRQSAKSAEMLSAESVSLEGTVKVLNELLHGVGVERRMSSAPTAEIIPLRSEPVERKKSA